jgi:two-component system, OmpR family, sensor histidine kinase SenX3
MKYYLQPIPLNEVLEDLRKNSLSIFQEAGFTVEFDIQEGIPCVLCDRQALFRCLQNLIGNAAKYSDKIRWIGICAELGESTSGVKEIRISVRDRGVGISSSELRKIFEPFYRGRGAVAAQIHGTGLGLSLARNIAEAMGGSLSVTSEVGVGSVFTLHLQVAEGPYPSTVGTLETATSR